MRTWTLATSILLFLLINVATAQVEGFNKGFAWLQFQTPIGCSVQVQSFNESVSKKDLDKLISLFLNFGTEEGRGFFSEFRPPVVFFSELSYDSLSHELIEASIKEANRFDSTILRLEKYQPPLLPFNEVKKKLLENYKHRQQLNKIFLSYIKTNDAGKFKNEILNFYSDSIVVELFNKLENEKAFRERVYFIPVKIFNEVSHHFFRTDNIQKLEERLLTGNKIKIVYEKCED